MCEIYTMTTILSLFATFIVATLYLIHIFKIGLQTKQDIILFIIAIIYIVMSWYSLLQRETYLPFLGNTAFPPFFGVTTAISSTASNAITITLKEDEDDEKNTTALKLEPGTKVVWWAAKPSTTIFATPKLAYDDYSNAGVVLAKADGKVTITLLKPASYNVESMTLKSLTSSKKLEPHIHYRYMQKNGLFSKVYTHYIKTTSS